MLTKASPLIALPTALLLALSLSACDEDAVSIPSTRASSSAEADSTESPKDSPKDKEAKDSDDDSSTAPEASASADSSTGAEGDAKTVDISDLKTGNCVTEMVTGTKHGETGTTGAKLVDCSTPHQYEVIGTGQSTASSSTEANTPEEISTVCTPVLESYVGSPSTAEKYRVAALTPVQSSWDQGDHSFTCFAQNPDDTPLNNSIKNS
jgi:hypothetical protein avisC_05188